MGSGSLSGGPLFAELGAVGEVDVEPAVVIVVEEGQAGAFGFDDVAFVVGIAPDVGRVEAGFAGDVDELDWGFLRNRGSLEEGVGIPFPEGSGQGVEERGAEDGGGVGEEMAAGEFLWTRSQRGKE